MMQGKQWSTTQWDSNAGHDGAHGRAWPTTQWDSRAGQGGALQYAHAYDAAPGAQPSPDTSGLEPNSNWHQLGAPGDNS